MLSSGHKASLSRSPVEVPSSGLGPRTGIRQPLSYWGTLAVAAVGMWGQSEQDPWLSSGAGNPHSPIFLL